MEPVRRFLERPAALCLVQNPIKVCMCNYFRRGIQVFGIQVFNSCFASGFVPTQYEIVYLGCCNQLLHWQGFQY